MSPLLQLDERDNVAVALSPLNAGASDPRFGLLTTQTPIPAMHKVAVKPIASGDEVIKYGQPIGRALVDIAPGEHVHTHNCDASTGDKDYGFCRKTIPTDYIDPSKQAHFMGYRRTHGKVGTRNYIGIVTSVNCSATVAGHIAAQINQSGILEDYPNVDGVVALSHESGCGMRSSGDGYELLERTLVGYASHANFGGVVLIGLGCETMQLERLMQDNGLTESATFKAFTIQDSGGTRTSIAKGLQEVHDLLPLVNQCQRSKVPASELVLAVQCGGSDAFSGITANPALGVASDLVVRHGGTVIYAETPEIYGAEHLLTQRAETPEVAEKLIERIRWWENYTSAHGFELNSNPSPGNKTGGLTTIMEKSLGAQAKAGSTNLRAVYLYAEAVTEKGLVFMDSPGFDPVSVTGQVASGANVICFTTGRGSAFGFKPVPSLKLASNNALYESMKDDIDVNCGDIITGKSSVQAVGQQIFEAILMTASGQKTQSEELGYGHNEFNPWRLGATV